MIFLKHFGFTKRLLGIMIGFSRVPKQILGSVGLWGFEKNGLCVDEGSAKRVGGV